MPLFLILPCRCEASWTPDLRVSDTAGRSGLSEGNARSIALDTAGNFHMVWHDDTSGNYEIQYYASDSLNGSLVTPRSLTSNSGASLAPSIAIMGDSIVVVVWTDDSETTLPSIMFARFFAGADTMLDYGVVSTSAFMCSNPCVAVGTDSSLHVVWSENSAELSEVFYRKWHGDWLDAPLNLSASTSTSVNASVAVDESGDVHVAWADNITGNYEIFYKKYTNGMGWGSRIQVSTSATLAWSPSMGADSDGNAYVVWSDRRHGNFEIYFRRYLTGVGWGNQKRVTQNAAISANPSLAVDCVGNMHIVWEDFRDGNDEIYYRRITNSQGPGWDPVETRLTSESATSWDASVVADSSGNVHVLWADGRDGNFEIYYKYGDNPIPVDLALLSFYAECTVGGVLLRWDLSSDSPTALIDVFRSTGEGAAPKRLTQVSLIGQNEFLDTDVIDGARYEYYLGFWRGEADEHVLFGPLSVEFSLPSAVVLPVMKVWPNPVRETLNIEFVSGELNSPFRLFLLDVRGRMVSEIASGATSERVTNIPCDVANRLTRKLAPGIYFVSLELDGKLLEKKIVVLK
ncbi:MAG: hypothetical protein AMJ46_06965 [Latescibacteria bacterium DG_63]|nr:MAG: hypothetical protein AMJ46_06965 [Latescibacteria bacterium DG_63]